MLPGRLQDDLGHAAGDVDPCAAFDADRLESDLTVVSADQDVGRRADDNGALHRGTGVAAGKGAGSDVVGRKDQSDDLRLFGIADVDAEAPDVADIALAGTVGTREDAAQRLGGTEDEARATRDLARQRSDIDPFARGRSRVALLRMNNKCSQRQSRCRNNSQRRSTHLKSPSFRSRKELPWRQVGGRTPALSDGVGPGSARSQPKSGLPVSREPGTWPRRQHRRARPRRTL